MPIYTLSHSRTSDPRKISEFLSEQEEVLRNILSNVGEENLSDELFEKINTMQSDINTIKEQLQSLLSSEE